MHTARRGGARGADREMAGPEHRQDGEGRTKTSDKADAKMSYYTDK